MREDHFLGLSTGGLQRRGPRIEVVEVAGVGHAPTLTAPEHVRVIRDWLLG